MKKFILFVSTIFLSLFLINNKVFAQEFPVSAVRASYFSFRPEQLNQNTDEFTVGYTIQGYYPTYPILNENAYFLVNYLNVTFKKGLDRRTNSYQFERMTYNPDTDFTTITIRFTVLRSFLQENYPEGDYGNLFSRDTVLYIYKISPDAEDAYNIGFSDGYRIGYDDGRVYGENEGYGRGYSDGYTDGVKVAESEVYQRGYNDGANKSFLSNLDKWLVPAIIIVIIAGIFVGYRRERYGGE